MTADELLEVLDICQGPCGKLCISCPAGDFLKEIRDVILKLKEENNELRLDAAQVHNVMFF